MIKDLVDFFIQPLNVLMILLLMTLLGHLMKRLQIIKICFIAFVIVFLITGSSPIPNVLITSLEDRFSPLLDIDSGGFAQPVHVLVLGSGHVADPDLPPIGQLSSTAMSRLTEGIRLHQKLPNSVLIVSGYAGKSTIAQAQVLSDAAVSLGVDHQAVKMQKTPSTTEQEAIAYKSQYGLEHPLILVTSALHMPRSITIFQSRGLKPIAAPTHYLVKDDPNASFSWRLLSHENFYKVQAALHEYIGLIYEKWFSKTRQG